jgi:hypothetical protein
MVIRNYTRNGVKTEGKALVSASTITNNGAAGIRAGNGSLVRDSIVSFNGGAGVLVRDGSTVLGNTIMGNGGYGIQIDDGGTAGFGDNTLTGNGPSGAPQVSAGIKPLTANACSTTCR